MHGDPIIEAKPEALRPRAARPRIALAHDWLCGYRGGEGVLERVAALVESIAEPVGLWVMVDDARPISPTIDRWRARGLLRASWINDLPGAAARARRWLLPAYPLAVRDLSDQIASAHAREPIDLVISTSSSAIKNVRSPERADGTRVPHLCVCFAPARYVWSRRSDYARGSGARAWARAMGLGIAGGPFRAWDRAGSAGVDEFIAISTHVQREIARCYARPSTIVHPPVRTGYFTPDPHVAREDFWLVVSALEPYKRVERAIDAARQAGKTLLIAGSGSQEAALRAHAGGHSRIEFLGRVSDTLLRDLYRRARVLLFPQVEDFGIVAVEAQACGCPVAALNAGGALDIVRDGQTGVLTDDPTPTGLAEAAHRVERLAIAPDGCVANAARFSEEMFDAAMLARLRHALLTNRDRTRADRAG